MQELFGSFSENENSMENEVLSENNGDSYELPDQVEEEEDEINEDEENLFGVDKQVCEDMLENGPQSGVVFESKENLFVAYQTFAKLKGFSVSTRNISKDKYLMISCGRARKPNVKKHTKRMNCPARLNAIKQEYGNWKISKVINEHNHNLDPQLSEFIPAHRHLSSNLKLLLDAYDYAGLRTCNSVRMMEALAGGPPNLGASMKDCRNHIDKMQRLRLGSKYIQRCVIDKIQKELMAEYSTKCRPITCVSQFKWEAQFAKVYTNNVMGLFQEEVKKIWNCNLSFLETVSSVMDKYDITETRSLSKYSSSSELHFIVEHRPAGSYFECNCKKFESHGILCCHILTLLVYKKFDHVNERYILWRWRKDVYKPHSSIYFAGAYPHMSKEYKQFQEMEREFLNAAI